MRQRLWRVDRPVAVAATLGTLRRGRGDPAHRFEPTRWGEAVWRATRTPDGPVLLRLAPRPDLGAVDAVAWGPGAGWALDGVPELLGEHDDPAGFTPAPEHHVLVRAQQGWPGWRVPRSRAVLEALAAAAIEQRVTGTEAWRAWRLLLVGYGEPAPGPAQDDWAPGGSGPAGGTANPAAGMRLPPCAQTWQQIPVWDWLRAGVDQGRREAIRAAAAAAGRLEATVDLAPAEAARQLCSLPGVGRWTAAEVRQRAHGDADAFSWGDYHASRDVSWALGGRVLDDAGCAELIERYRGHRYRVQRLVSLAGAHRPRRGPRRSLPTHLPSAGGLARSHRG